MHRVWLIFTLMVFVVGDLAVARSLYARRHIPLMPPRSIRTIRTISYQPRYTSRVRKVRKQSSKTLFYGGLEIGTLGQRNRSNSDALGFRLLWGGQLFVLFPLFDRVSLKPSIGFFAKNDGAGRSSVTQYLATGAASIQYRFLKSRSITGFIGAKPSADINFSKMSLSPSGTENATGTSETSPLSWQFRLGPTLGFIFRINKAMGIVADFDLSFTFTRPTNYYGSLTSGMIFKF